MFCLWMCLSLIYVLQSTVSSDQGVSLTCNQTVTVTVGENVALICFINWTQEGECKLLSHVWRNTKGTKLCNRRSTKYMCDSNLSSVSLTVLNVQEEENFTVEILSNCGMEKSHPIRLQLIHSVSLSLTVSGAVGENVALKCFINWAVGEEECKVLSHVWYNTNGTKLCNSGSTKYMCDTDLSSVSLTVLNVQEEENFTVEILSNCGIKKSHPIRVQLLHDSSKSVEEEKCEDGPDMQLYVRIFKSAIFVAIFVFLCIIYRHRETA